MDVLEKRKPPLKFQFHYQSCVRHNGEQQQLHDSLDIVPVCPLVDMFLVDNNPANNL